MQIIFKDYKKGKAKLKVENKDDLWYLTNIIDKGDIVKGLTTRKIKLDGGSEDRKAKVIVKTIVIPIYVEKVEFHKYNGDLRISGKITEGQDDIPTGSYHTLNIEEGSIITIYKHEWLNFQVKKLNEAAQNKQTNIIICVFDREEAIFALLKKYGYDVISEIKGDVQKKLHDESIKANFFSEIIKTLELLDSRYSPSKIILASPAFWKDELCKELNSQVLKKKVIFATTSSATRSAITETLKRPEVATALKEDRVVKEINLVEELFGEIKKEGAAVYGIEETKNAAAMGAVKDLLVTESLIQEKRQKNEFGEIEWTMKQADNAGGEVHIIGSDHTGGKTLDGLGGIGAILRYKIR